MERASRLIGNLNHSKTAISAEQIACTAWPGAVGKKIASHARAAKLVRKHLIVEVEDHVWQGNLFGLSRFILGNLERMIGRGIVEDIEFRVVPPRREPRRAQSSVPEAADDADQIRDPVLRNIYKAARRREMA